MDKCPKGSVNFSCCILATCHLEGFLPVTKWPSEFYYWLKWIWIDEFQWVLMRAKKFLLSINISWWILYKSKHDGKYESKFGRRFKTHIWLFRLFQQIFKVNWGQSVNSAFYWPTTLFKKWDGKLMTTDTL